MDCQENFQAQEFSISIQMPIMAMVCNGAFYDNPNVCTISIHETGKYLFPGTGNIYERGYGKGYGYSFNIPLEAFTEDESWLEAYETTVLEVADYFFSRMSS